MSREVMAPWGPINLRVQVKLEMHRKRSMFNIMLNGIGEYNIDVPNLERDNDRISREL